MATFRICANPNQYRILRSTFIGFSSPKYVYNINYKQFSNKKNYKNENNSSIYNKGVLIKLAAVGVISLTIGNWQKYIFVLKFYLLLFLIFLFLLFCLELYYIYLCIFFFFLIYIPLSHRSDCMNLFFRRLALMQTRMRIRMQIVQL